MQESHVWRKRIGVHPYCNSTGRGYVSFLSALETTSFFEASFPFIRCKLLGLLLGVDVHGIGVSGGSIPGGGGGVECDRGSG